jgi:hypothetical protein
MTGTEQTPAQLTTVLGEFNYFMAQSLLIFNYFIVNNYAAVSVTHAEVRV